MRQDLIKKIAEEIKSRTNVTQRSIYDCFASERMDEYTTVDGISVNYNYYYGYVDVVGLKDDEFQSLLSHFDNWDDSEEEE